MIRPSAEVRAAVEALRSAAAAVPPTPATARVAPLVEHAVAEFRPEAASLPRFHVWTLGCQMNLSDSEEMAGQLLAAGCTPAPSLEEADLVVVNTCAVREHAEARVIGRQGLLAELKRTRPGIRVLLTGCAVREAERHGLASRFPAVDLFLRPDEEPELAQRLGPGPGGTANDRHCRHHDRRRASSQRRRPPRAKPRHGPRRGASGAVVDHLGMAADRVRLR